MVARSNGRAFQYVLVDVNTQIDFCDKKGVSPVRNIDDLIPGLRRIIAWAKRNSIPVVSSLESHRPLELSDSGTPICCVDGSDGQRKLSFTVFPARTNIEVDNTFSVPVDLFKKYQQAIFRKRSNDLLLNPKADRLLTQLPVGEYVLCGAGLEGSVKSIALALLARGKPVAIVADACGHWDPNMAELAIRQLVAKGARMISIEELRGQPITRLIRYPSRKSIANKRGTSRVRMSFNRLTMTATGARISDPVQDNSSAANSRNQDQSGHSRRQAGSLSPSKDGRKMPKRKR